MVLFKLGEFLLATALATTSSTTLSLNLKQEVESMRKAEPTQTEIVIETIKSVFGKDAPTMIKVAECESSFRHFKDDGSVLRGIVDQRDSGAFQINKGYHEKEAETLGLDIDRLEHNVIYAKLLYDKEGLKPWKASYDCLRKKGVIIP